MSNMEIFGIRGQNFGVFLMADTGTNIYRVGLLIIKSVHSEIKVQNLSLGQEPFKRYTFVAFFQ